MKFLIQQFNQFFRECINFLHHFYILCYIRDIIPIHTLNENITITIFNVALLRFIYVHDGHDHFLTQKICSLAVMLLYVIKILISTFYYYLTVSVAL